jgi:hypothetical protein
MFIGVSFQKFELKDQKKRLEPAAAALAPLAAVLPNKGGEGLEDLKSGA